MLVDVHFVNKENFRRFHELNAKNYIEIRTFMALPDVDDTDEISRMTENDFRNKTFKNVGFRVSLFELNLDASIDFPPCSVCRLKIQAMQPL